jgi:hypothetical protein
MANETLVAAQWMYGVLAADATLTGLVGSRIYQDVAPGGATFPYVVFFLLDPGDTLNTTGTSQEIIWQPTLWLVKGVHKMSGYGAPLATIESRIFALLHKATNAAPALGTMWTCYRVRPFQMPETGPGGEQYRHLGGVYRIKVS